MTTSDLGFRSKLSPCTHEDVGKGGCIHLVQLLIPVYDNAGVRFPPDLYTALREELTSKFGGLTAYTRAPAQGTWQDAGERPIREDIVIYEVMVEHLDATWWATYRRTLEARFEQGELVVRALRVERL